MKKRLLSAFLAVMMVLTMVPAVFAADEETVVAKIGDTGYTSLQKAINAINNVSAKPDDHTVTLVADTKEDITFPENYSLVLNLNGKKLANKIGHTITVPESADVVIHGPGTIDNVTHGKGALVNYGHAYLYDGVVLERSQEKGIYEPYENGGNSWYTILNDKGGQLLIVDATVRNAGGYSSAIRNGGTSESTLTIKGGNITGGINAVKNDEWGILTIEDGIFSNSSQYVVMNWNKTTINGGTFSAKESSQAVLQTAKYKDSGAGELTIKGGTFKCTGNQDMIYPTYNDSTEYQGTASVIGGKFDASVSEYLADGYIQNEDGTVESLNENNAVAKISDTYYATLADAYAALPRNVDVDSEPTTITLLKDAEGKAIGTDSDKGMNYVIDFGGHTYTVGKPAVGSTGTETQGLRVLKGCKAVFKNGTLKAANYHDMKMPVHTYGDVTFENFTVDASEDSYAQVAYEVDNGSLKMLGNSSILAYPGKTGLYVAFWPEGGYVDGTTVTVDTTGKITGKLVYEWDDKADVNEQQKENKAVLNISNGKFDITGIQTLFTDSIPSELKIPKISISGGYFTSDPSAYCVAGKTGVASDIGGYKFMVGELKEDTIKGVAITEGESQGNPVPKVEGVAKDDEDAAKEVAQNVGSKTISDSKAISNDEKLNAVTALKNINAINVGTDGKIEGNTEVSVIKQLYLDVTVNGYDVSDSSKEYKISMDITPKYNLIATTDKNGATKTVTFSTGNKASVTARTEVTVTLPKEFAGKLVYINHNDKNLYTATADENGKITFVTDGFSPFTFTLTKPSIFNTSSGGSSGGSASKTTYKVTTSSVANGGVNVSPSSSAKGDKVKITLSPNKGYKLDKLTVTDASGKTVSTTKTSDTVYTFTMPASQVTVGVTYVKADETTEQPSTKTFSDVASTDWFADAVKYVSDKGMMNGTGNGKFSPADSTTRGMLMTVIARYAGQDTTGSNPWYQKGMEWAKANGVSDGTAPNANITREQLVTMLCRYAKSTGKDVSVGEDTNILSYADATTVSQYAIPAMQWACGAGIVNGANGKLNPQNNATRAEVAAILMRFCENIK